MNSHSKGTGQPAQRRPKSETTRSFAKTSRTEVYLLEGVEENPHVRDTKELFDSLVAAGVEQGLSRPDATDRAYELREKEFGIGKEHGFYGESVEYWFPGNVALLLKPIKHNHTLIYYERFHESIDQTIAKILFVMTKNHAMMTGIDKTDFERDEWGAIVVPTLGPIYGPIDQYMTDLVAFILSIGGKVVGRNPLGDYITEPISFEQVLSTLPHGFVNMQVAEGTTVFDEVLTVSTVFVTEDLDNLMEETSAALADPAPEQTTTLESLGIYDRDALVDARK